VIVDKTVATGAMSAQDEAPARVANEQASIEIALGPAVVCVGGALDPAALTAVLIHRVLGWG
jgi:hypothetical protein